MSFKYFLIFLWNAGWQCIATGKGYWLRSVPAQWTLFWIGKCMFWETHNNHNYVYINNAPIYFFLRGPYSLVTHVTVIRSSRRFTFANHFGIRCSNTRRRISGPRKLCFHVWPTCSTVSLRRKRKSDPLHRKSSSQDFARKRVNSGFIIDIYLIYVQQSFFYLVQRNSITISSRMRTSS